MNQVQQMMEQQLLRAAQEVEDQIDSEMHKLENMDDDDIERLRQKRIDELKRCGAYGSAHRRLPPARRRRCGCCRCRHRWPCICSSLFSPPVCAAGCK